MANASKSKGDRAELEAVRAIIELCPDLCLWNAQRMLGAGRKEDIGDLLVFANAAVQVKAFKSSALSAGLYSAAAGASEQAARARHPYALGLVLVPRARLQGAVRWAASVNEWPIEREHEQYTSSLAALDAVKTAGPDSDTTAQVRRKNAVPIVVGSLQNWVRAYRIATDQPRPEGSST